MSDRPLRFMTQEERVLKMKEWRFQYRNPYPCDMCGERFRNKVAVKDHKQEVHAY